MSLEITPINLGGLLGYGVNCYLLKTASGFILIDTGISPKRALLELNLDRLACRPGDLKLILLTHGHLDHIGNCAYLRAKVAAPVAMHRLDADMVNPPAAGKPVLDRLIAGLLGSIFGLGKLAGFSPDLYLEDGDSLSAYGLPAHVLHLPGHSPGSIGILTSAGDLFCGDIFVNGSRPARHSIVTDAAAFDASVARLKTLGVERVYPGHGRPFRMAELLRDR